MQDRPNAMDDQDKPPEDRAEERSSESLTGPESVVDTGGGAVIGGDVTVQGGDFVGRDQITIKEEAAYDVRGLPNPYLGLSAFTYGDQAAFGGREAGVRQAVEKLTSPGSRQALLFISGASGCGKSSFAQAGLLPALVGYYEERKKARQAREEATA